MITLTLALVALVGAFLYLWLTSNHLDYESSLKRDEQMMIIVVLTIFDLVCMSALALWRFF